MKAARLYEAEAPMRIETMSVPDVRPDEVLVRVEACNVVQNLANVLKGMDKFPGDFPFPRLPAVFGLDATGTVERCGALVSGFREGDRVYVNPGLSCGGCEQCRSENSIDCEGFGLRGYFGIGRKSQRSLDDHPQGGFAQFMTAPQRNLVMLPNDVSFETASRFGYLGTAFRALKLADCGTGKTVLINGISGTLGLGAAALAVAMGAKRILGTARNRQLFSKVEALAEPGRIAILESGSRDATEWSREITEGEGVDIVIDALSGGAPPEPTQQALYSLKRGGRLVNIGAIQGDVPLNLFWALSNNISIIGSSWFTTRECQQMADMVGQGDLDLSFFENKRFPLEEINAAIESTNDRNGGFTNYVVTPNA